MQEVPELTARVARRAFPRGAVAMRMRDCLGPIFEDAQFADLFAQRGHPSLSPGRLALVSMLQYAENLTDRQAADAVRARLDWKYALSLPLTDPGFDSSVLSEFRARLLQDSAAGRLLDVLLARLKEAGLLGKGGRARSDSTRVLAAVRTLYRLELVTETMRAALETLAVAAPSWLARLAPTAWFDRYERKADAFRIGTIPKHSQTWDRIIEATPRFTDEHGAAAVTNHLTAKEADVSPGFSCPRAGPPEPAVPRR
jgi:transposase